MDTLSILMKEVNIWMAWALFLIGMIQCCLGYRWMRLWLALCMGALFFGISVGISSIFEIDNTIKTFLYLIFPIFGVILGAIFYRFGRALVCGFGGIVIGCCIGLFGSALLSIVLSVFIGCLFYSAGRAFPKQASIIATGISGGLISGVSLVTVWKAEFPEIALILGFCLALFGVGFQFLNNKTIKFNQNNIVKIQNDIDFDDHEREDSVDRTNPVSIPPPLRHKPDDLFPKPDSVSMHVSSRNANYQTQNTTYSSHSKNTSQDILDLLNERNRRAELLQNSSTCATCGNILRKDSIFCDKCGSRVK